MPKIIFPRDQVDIEVEENTKILVAARRAKADIRFGCASCKCGTCAVRVNDTEGELSPIADDEARMLKKLELDHEANVRMACRSRIMSGTIVVDLEFQDEYEIPDQFEE